MAKSIKTNNVQELLKAKGLAKGKKKASEHKPVPRETSRKRLYDLVSDDVEQNIVPNSEQNQGANKVPNKVENIVANIGQNEIPNVEPNKVLNIEQPTIQNMERIEAPNIEQNQAPNMVQIKAQNIDPNKELNKARKTADTARIRNMGLKEEPNKGLNQVQNKIPNQAPIKVLNEALNIEPKAVPSLVPGTTTFETTFRNMFQVPTKIPGLSELKILFLFKQILDATGQIAFQKKQLSEVLDIKLETIKTSITRLKTKGYIKLKEYADGRSVGYSIFELTEKANEVLASPKALAALNGGSSASSKNVVPKHSSNPSLIIIEDNKEIIREEIFLPESLKAITSPAYFQRYIGGKLSLEQIQESVEHFAYDYENGNIEKKYEKNPMALLFSNLKKEIAYTSAPYIEKTKRERDEANKQINESIAIKAEIRREKFKIWKQDNPAAYQVLLSDADPVVKGRESLADAHVMKKWDENKC